MAQEPVVRRATVFGGGLGWQSDEEPTRWQRSTAPGVGAVTGGEANGADQIEWGDDRGRGVGGNN